MNTTYAQIAKKLPSWLYKLGAQLWIDKEYPRHIFLETTATCNLSCSYCPREKIKQDMDFSIFKGIVDEATSYGPRSFSLHLFGEPLLYPKWFEAIRYIKSANRKHTVLLTTNGTLLEKGDNLDKLIHSGADQVLWSWRKEAKFSKETKEKLRKWGKFRLRIINELTPKEVLEEWKDWPNKEERNLHNYGGNIQTTKFGGMSSQVPESRYPCYHLWLAPGVAWNGNILICCADPHHKEVLGKFPAQSVSELWQGEKLNDIRNSHLRGEYGGICTNCDVWKNYPNLFFQFPKRV